jgi:transcription elongation factor GreA
MSEVELTAQYWHSQRNIVNFRQGSRCRRAMAFDVISASIHGNSLTQSDMSDVVYLTRERLRELEEEIRRLKTDERKEIAQKIAEARSYGDLSENAEYDAAKEAQGLLEARIYKLEQTMAKARIIEAGNMPNDKVYILSVVKVLNKTANREIEYTLVSAEEADIEQRKIAVTSPIGKGLMGRKVGDVVQVTVPAGKITLEILEISR